MAITTIIKVATAIVTFTIVCFAFRHRLIPALVMTCRQIAWMLQRPNPNATWQDAYAPHCKRCGYDLRASPNECPECGEPVPAYERTIIHYLIKLGDGPRSR